MDKTIMSEEVFNEIVEGFEHIRALTEWGSKNIKYHIQKLQQENGRLKQAFNEIEKIILKATTDGETGKDLGYSDKTSYDDLLEIIQKAKGE